MPRRHPRRWIPRLAVTWVASLRRARKASLSWHRSFDERKLQKSLKLTKNPASSASGLSTFSTSAQTDGAPLPTIGVTQGEPGAYFTRLEQLVSEQGISLEHSAEIAPAKGMSCGKKIILLPGMAPAEQFSTLVHELAHEMLHRDARRSQTTQRVRETEAEAVAFVVSKAIGLDTNTAAQETTLLNALGKLISDDDRILLIEDTSEIQLEKPNLVRFEARQAQSGLPAVAIRDLLKASLRHRPDRIILGEIRGGEAFDLLQLLNTGHSGTLSTVHASSAQQAISRFTSCVLQSGVELPYRAIKTNIGDSLNVIIQLERRPGRRYVSQVLEVQAFNAERDQYEFISVYDEKSNSADATIRP